MLERLTPFQQGLIADALRAQRLKWLRVWFGIPVWLAVSALAFWFFTLRDGGDSSVASIGMALAPTLALGALIAVMLINALSESLLRDTLDSFGLKAEEQRALRDELRASRFAAMAHAGAREAALGELREGVKQGVEHAARSSIGGSLSAR